jgi:hypothetical protein
MGNSKQTGLGIIDVHSGSNPSADGKALLTAVGDHQESGVRSQESEEQVSGVRRQVSGVRTRVMRACRG